MIRGDYAREGQVESGYENSRLILEQGRRVGAPMPILSDFADIMQAAFEAGDGDRNTAALVEVFR